MEATAANTTTMTARANVSRPYAGEQSGANAVTTAAAMPAPDQRARALALPGEPEQTHEAGSAASALSQGERLCLRDEVRRFETELIRRALTRTGGHQRRAARLLSIKTTTLHAKIKRYRLGSYAAPEIDGEIEVAGQPHD